MKEYTVMINANVSNIILIDSIVSIGGNSPKQAINKFVALKGYTPEIVKGTDNDCNCKVIDILTQKIYYYKIIDLINDDLKNVILNAIHTALRDDYNQVIYRDETTNNSYAFSRDYPNNNMFNSSNVVGKVIVDYVKGVRNARYVKYI